MAAEGMDYCFNGLGKNGLKNITSKFKFFNHYLFTKFFELIIFSVSCC
jgi:hypothetical protein